MPSLRRDVKEVQLGVCETVVARALLPARPVLVRHMAPRSVLVRAAHTLTSRASASTACACALCDRGQTRAHHEIVIRILSTSTRLKILSNPEV